MAGGDPGEHGSRQRGLAAHHAPGRHHGQGTRRGDAEGVHGVADDVLAQHRAHRGPAVPAAGEGRAAGTLEVQVARAAVGAGELAEQQGAPVAEPRAEPAELVPGVGLGDRRGAGRDGGPDQQPDALGAAQPGGVQAELGGQRIVEDEQPGVRSLLGLPGDGHLRQLAGEVMIKDDGGQRGDTHPTQTIRCSQQPRR
jgi:hypothetical protein